MNTPSFADPLVSQTTFDYEILIPFHFVDAVGIVFFGHAMTLAHQAFEHFIIEGIQIPWSAWFQNTDWIVPIKHCEADYFFPIKAGESCRISLKVFDIGSSSFTMVYSFYQNDHICCMAKTVHVFCHKTTKQKLVIPQTIMEKLQIFKR